TQGDEVATQAGSGNRPNEHEASPQRASERGLVCERRLAPAGAINGAPALPRRTRITPAHRTPSILAVAVMLVAVLLASMFPRTASAAQPMEDACQAIRDLAVDVAEAVTLGVVVVDLQTGERCTLNGDRPFRTASLYKIVVAAELYRQV